MVERGFAALSVMAQCWEESLPEEGEDGVTNNVVVAGRAIIAKALTNLLQVAWLRPAEMVGFKYFIYFPVFYNNSEEIACINSRFLNKL